MYGGPYDVYVAATGRQALGTPRPDVRQESRVLCESHHPTHAGENSEA